MVDEIVNEQVCTNAATEKQIWNPVKEQVCKTVLDTVTEQKCTAVNTQQCLILLKSVNENAW